MKDEDTESDGTENNDGHGQPVHHCTAPGGVSEGFEDVHEDQGQGRQLEAADTGADESQGHEEVIALGILVDVQVAGSDVAILVHDSFDLLGEGLRLGGVHLFSRDVTKGILVRGAADEGIPSCSFRGGQGGGSGGAGEARLVAEKGGIKSRSDLENSL